LDPRRLGGGLLRSDGKAAYASVFSCLQALATAKALASVVAALLQEGEEDPNDLIALDAARQ
jgi:hydroxymethylglutaryl-CoA reductase